MKNILILGALPKDKAMEELYQTIAEVCKSFAVEIFSPIDTVKFMGGERERYERAFEMVGKADLIIGEQSHPSTGQGMEIREAAVLGKPIIVVAKAKSRVSGLVKGCPAVKEIIFYRNMDDLKEKLLAAIQKR